MLTKDFDYNLPRECIAQQPTVPRDHSRLMVVNKERHQVEHKIFFDIVEYLQPGDVLVWNNSKVFKARLFGRLLSQNNQGLWEHQRDVEIFLVRPKENIGVWHVMAKPGKHVQNGTRVEFAPDFVCDVVARKRDGTILVQFADDEFTVREKANKYGHIPVPPYVKDEPHELESYQTVYAQHEGSVAAPTAGFHFTSEVIEKIRAKGVEFAEVTLHVGLGTFLPVKSEHVEDHTMHSEWVEVSEETADKINRAKATGRRVIAVGTTTVRTLEAVVRVSAAMEHETHGDEHHLRPYRGEVNLFILPGFEFKVVDAMITNFHLPKSTLLMLVAAFIGDTEFTLWCYNQAVTEKYRFFSFGDAMFIC